MQWLKDANTHTHITRTSFLSFVLFFEIGYFYLKKITILLVKVNSKKVFVGVHVYNSMSVNMIHCRLQ